MTIKQEDSEPHSSAATIPWNTQEGRKRLFDSKFHKDFFTLAHCFQPQIKPTFCGVASAVIICNALRAGTGLKLDSRLDVKIPKSSGGGIIPFNSYSQLTFLGSQTDRIKDRRQIEGKIVPADDGSPAFNPGLTLDELASQMRMHLLKIKICKANTYSQERITAFRNDLKAFLNDNKVFVVANYMGRDLGKDVGGHFSPVAAYHSNSDSCLVMDVAGHRHAWFWVEVPILYRAMHTKDGNSWRGWIQVSDKLGR